MSQAQLSPVHPTIGHSTAVGPWSRLGRYLAGVLALALAYYCAAKLGQALRYTASVSAIWPPAGVGIAALYLFGLRWWPGVMLAELVINAELLGGPGSLPLISVVGQQAGNMAEILVGAILLRRLIGPGAGLDGAQRVGGVVVAVAAATALSATAGTASMLVGSVIEPPQAATFWRTWWLGDFAGGLIVVPAALAWRSRPGLAWRRVRTWDGAVVLVAVAALAAAAVSTSEPVTYVVFPALMWAAFRFGAPGATVAVAIAAGVVIGITADDVGPFSKQPIDHKTLSTQVYVVVMALTTLFVAAVVSDRERSARQLAEAERREEQRATEERHRIARDLHDSVSQALFSTVLETRTAQKALAAEGTSQSGQLARRLAEIASLTRGAQSEMRAMIFQLDRDPLEGGLKAAILRHVEALVNRNGLVVEVDIPHERLPVSPATETQLLGIAREALTNVVKHAGARTASVRAEAHGASVVLEISDDGGGFDPSCDHPGHFGLESMRGRAAQIGGRLDIASGQGRGTVVRVEVAADRG